MQHIQPQAHKHHNGILAVLLICCLALLIAIFGIAALQLSTDQETVPVVVTEVEQEEEDEIATASFSGLYGRVPTFEYPYGWHIAYSTNYKETFVRVEPGPIEEETEVGPGISTIAIQREQTPALEDDADNYTDDFVAKYESSSVTQEIVSQTTEQLTNGTLTNFIVIRSPHGDPLEQEFILFETETDYILISFINVGEEAEAGWQIIKDSLDFNDHEVIDYDLFSE